MGTSKKPETPKDKKDKKQLAKDLKKDAKEYRKKWGLTKKGDKKD